MIYKLTRIRSVVEEAVKNPAADINRLRKDFTILVDEHDRRRGTNFLETFPELATVYNDWKKL